MSGVIFEDNSQEVLRLMKGATESAARIIGGKVRDYARQSVDRARGPRGGAWPANIMTAIKNSLTVKVEATEKGPALAVGSNMEIAPYIELGTGKLYSPSAEWVEYHGDDAHSVGGLDSWLYFDPIDGEVKVGRPVPAQPYLAPAFTDHVDEYREIVEKELRNA